MTPQTFETTIAGQTLRVETGKLATQADGSVYVQYGDTSVLVTVVMGDRPTGGDYLPLFVDYQEKFYASGKIKGSRFVKREGRPSEEAILTGRLVDRALRPFFDSRLRNEIQVIVTVLSMDDRNDPDVPALFGASLALSISDIPWDGPVAGLRFAKRDGSYIENPSFEDRLEGTLDSIVTLNKDGRLVMMETGAHQALEQDIVDGLVTVTPSIQAMLDFQREIQTAVGKEKRIVELAEDDTEKVAAIKAAFDGKLEPLLYGDKYTTKSAKTQLLAQLEESFADDMDLVHKLLKDAIGEMFKTGLLESERRPDNRSLTEVRPLSAEVDLLPRVHGSSLFNRGETQSLSVLTLGAPGESQIIDEMEEEYKKRYMHHYNFPPYSVGEVRPLRGPGRREIGHGSLAEKALEPVIPDVAEFPYTVRIVTEVLGSNGSSSMASACSSTLALMAAGVPIKAPVAGIAMGIVEDEETGVYKLLTDIQGPEDHYGEMDFKVAGTKDGVTAIQMDVKGSGMTTEVFQEALGRAKEARLHILDVMNAVIDTPRASVSEHAPKIEFFMINPVKIGEVIGSGGKIINKIIEETGVKIDIEDDGQVFVSGTEADKLTEAVEWIQSLAYEPEVGEELEGKVVKIMPFGAFVQIKPGTDGLLHISEMSTERIEKVESVIQLGQTLNVVVKSIDQEGRVNFALKEKFSPPKESA